MSSYAAQKGLLFAALLAALLTVSLSSFHTSVYNTETDFLDDLLVGTGLRTTSFSISTTVQTYIPTTVYTTEGGLPTTISTSILGPVTTVLQTHAHCWGIHCYKPLSVPPLSARDTLSTLPTQAPAVPRNYYQSPPAHRDRDDVGRRSKLDLLEKRKKGKGGYGDSGSSTGNTSDEDDAYDELEDIKRAIIPVILNTVWGCLVLCWTIAHLIVGWRRPTSRFVSVKTDLWILGVFIFTGLAILVTVSLHFGFIFLPFILVLSPLPKVGHAFGWVLWVVLVVIFLFEFIHVTKRYGGRGSFSKSIRTLCSSKSMTASLDPTIPHSLDQKPGLSPTTSNNVVNASPHHGPTTTASSSNQWAVPYQQQYGNLQPGQYNAPGARPGQGMAHHDRASPPPSSFTTEGRAGNTHGQAAHGQGAPQQASQYHGQAA